MKKINYLVLSLMIIMSAIGLCACGGSEDDTTTKDTTVNSTDAPTTTAKNEVETTTEADDRVDYKVTVVDEAGNPIAGAMVQCCKDSCVPAVTNDSGVAEFKLTEDDYDVKFVELPDGYEYSSDVEVFNFEDGKYELTITLKKAS